MLTQVEDMFVPAAAFKPSARKPRLDGDAWIVAKGDAVECNAGELARGGDLLLQVSLVAALTFGGTLFLEAADLGLGSLHGREAYIDTRVPETARAARSQLAYFEGVFADRADRARGPEFTIADRRIGRALVGDLGLSVIGAGGADGDVHRLLGVIVRRVRIVRSVP